MSNKEELTITRRRVGEIPLLQATASKIRCQDVLERHIPCHGNEKVSSVDTLMLLAFNIAGGRQPLYELEEWVRKLEPGMFQFGTIPEGLFNDDRFGRALDKLYAVDRASVMTELVLEVVRATSLDLSELHNDSTTLKAFGNMPGRTRNGLFLAKGYSKDHRPDLKQLLYCLTISADGAVPVHFKAYPGNRTDDTTHIETWEELRKVAGKDDFLYVADCKVCTDKQLFYITRRGGRVVTIMPDTWAEAESFKKELRKKKKVKTIIWRRQRPNAVDEETETFSCFDGNHKTTKRGYTIYWIYSTEKKKRDRSTRETRLQKVEQDLTHLMGKLNARNLKTKAQIMKCVGDILKHHDAAQFYHIELMELKEQHTQQVGRGRPGKTTKYKTHYTVIYSLSWARRKKVLQQELNTDGIFPLLTTDSEFSAKKTLVAYKYQPRLEKRFQQLKSVHEGAPLLFKKIERIEAILFLFFLALILQAVIERQVRLKMKTDKIDAIPIYPEDRPASHPTTTKIFDRFYDVSTYRLMEAGIGVKSFKDALTTLQKELLELLEISEEDYWHFPDQKGQPR